MPKRFAPVTMLTEAAADGASCGEAPADPYAPVSTELSAEPA